MNLKRKMSETQFKGCSGMPLRMEIFFFKLCDLFFSLMDLMESGHSHIRIIIVGARRSRGFGKVVRLHGLQSIIGDMAIEIDNRRRKSCEVFV